MWPIRGGGRPELEDFLKNKLRMDDSFLEDLGPTVIKQNKDPKAKIQNEVIVTIETKELRDAVRAQASNLANYPDCGMRLHIPNHLQKDFKALMGLAYDMKQKYSQLRRNVKFDEDDTGLFMDMQLTREGSWKRVKPEQAKQALIRSGNDRSGPSAVAADELVELLGDEDCSSANE